MHNKALLQNGDTMSNIGFVSPLFSFRINSHPSICNATCPYCGIFYEGMQCPNCGEIDKGGEV